jgi:hypothetical protein
MPLSTNTGLEVFTSGQVLNASSMNTSVNQQTLLYYASYAALTAALTGATSPVAGVHAYLLDEQAIVVYNGTNWIQITPEATAVQTGNESFTGTTYTTNQPATAGPAISIRTGTSALITVSSNFLVNGTTLGFHAFAVSGATTLAASDNFAMRVDATGSGVSQSQGVSKVILITGLTAGLNTFTSQYRVNGGTGGVSYRYISGTGLLGA